MKRLLTYFLLISFVIQSYSGLWIVASFYIQQDYIAETQCINRFDAMPVCNGHCYLTQKLEESENNELQRVPVVKAKEVQLYTQTRFSFALTPVCRFRTEKIPATNQRLTSQWVVTSVFQPPERA